MGSRSRDRAARAAAGQSAEPADVQAGHRAVHRRLHRRRARRRRSCRMPNGRWSTTPRQRDAAGVPCGVDRQPRRAAAARQTATATLDTTTRRRRSDRAATSLFDPDAGVRRCWRSRQRRLAQPEHLHRRASPAACRRLAGNTKPLSPTLQRGFVVFAQNTDRRPDTQLPDDDPQPAAGRARVVQPVPAAAVHRASPAR